MLLGRSYTSLGRFPEAIRAYQHAYDISKGEDVDATLGLAEAHAALKAEIDRVKAMHGMAVLYDCHSIRSLIPFLFDGPLPDFNIGTDTGRSCDARIEKAAAEIAGRA